MIRGWRIDPLSGNLALEAGDLVSVEGDEATAQEIRTRLLLFRGEAFTDLREGMPYYDQILVKAPDLGRIREIFRQAILSVPSVVDVPVLTVDLERATRRATITWEARTVEGRIVRSDDFPPMRIDG